MKDIILVMKIIKTLVVVVLNCDDNYPEAGGSGRIILVMLLIQIMMIVTVVIFLTVKLLKLEELEATRKDLEESLVESQGDNRSPSSPQLHFT